MTNQLKDNQFEEKRQLATVLCVSIQGVTQLADRVDIASIQGSLKELFLQFDKLIQDHKGFPAVHWGNTLLAIWGGMASGESDAELAVKAALSLQELSNDALFSVKLGIEPIKLKAGIHIGYVLGLKLGVNQDFTYLGEAINDASDLAGLAHPGSILISESILRQLKGAFKVSTLPSIESKDKKESSIIYLIEGIQDTTGRARYGGKDSMQSHLVGRDAEMTQLIELYNQAQHSIHPVFSLITGEDGIGKSRLLLEFSSKLESINPSFYLLSARSLAQTVRVPFYLWKRVIFNRFGISIGDPDNVSREKFMHEFQRVWGRQLGPVPAIEAAHMIGSLVGIGFSASQYLNRFIQDTLGRVNYAFELTRELLSRIATSRPTVLMMDDLQWADEDTLDLLQYFLHNDDPNQQPLPLLILATARLGFIEKHPKLAEQATVIKINPLKTDPYIVSDAYPGIKSLPETTLETLASLSRGNPYFLEELVRRLITSSNAEDAETLEDKLARLRAQSPESLLELLKMRMEDLPRGVRAMTMLASISGRVFWVGTLDAAIRAVSGKRTDLHLKLPSALIDASLQDALELLTKAELAFPKANTKYSGEQEYIFKHDLLRDVAYDMVPAEFLAQYHMAVGHWLLAHPEGEFKIQAADHFEIAKAFNEAEIACEQAANYYSSLGAVGEAQMLLERVRIIHNRSGM
jgi:class 3 adenylate cyclase